MEAILRTGEPEMENERYVERGGRSFFGEYLYDQVVVGVPASTPGLPPRWPACTGISGSGPLVSSHARSPNASGNTVRTVGGSCPAVVPRPAPMTRSGICAPSGYL